jgi:Spy/CpxP family protein refolding chaperone
MAAANPFDRLTWTPEAEAKLHNIPYFARTQARQQIEQLAREEDCDTITLDLVERARLEHGQ